MQSRPPPVGLAIVAGAMVVAFSVTNAMGADPADDEANGDQHAPGLVEMLLFGDEASADDDAPDDASPATHPGNRGACVREVAKSEDSGGPAENHGGAVHEAARVSCREQPQGDDGAPADGREGPQPDDAGGSRPGGNSGDAHEKNADRKGGSGGNGGG